MLKSRILTAVIFIAIVVASLFYFPLFVALVLSVTLISLWEWTRLAGFTEKKGRVFCFIATLLIPAVLYLFLLSLKSLDVEPEYILDLMAAILLSPLLFWGLATLALIFYPKGISFYTRPFMGPIIGAWLLFPPVISVISLYRSGIIWTLYPLVLVWVADIAAYFVGKRFGRHQLHPLSPKKTWEGVVGGLLGGMVVSIIGFYLLDIGIYRDSLSIFIWVLFNLIIVLVSVVGDLFESLFKRVRNLKDSGNILPGHGGMLDRIDSLTAALPLFLILGQFI